MPSLGCFWDPGGNYEPRELTDLCPSCGRAYGHPLVYPPDQVGDWQILRPLDRGFYGAIYVAQRGRLKTKAVLKIIPTSVYEHFGKDFYEECATHAEVSQGTSHLVGISDAFDADVRFGDSTLPCHVAVLDYVNGRSLRSLLEEPAGLTATTVAQLATDLFSLLHELDQKQTFHNDLHPGNIVVETLPDDQRRAQAIDPSVRAIAVDLGSVTDRSRSDEPAQRSDLHEIASQILTLSEGLLSRPQEGTDADNRLATGLQELAHWLLPDTVAQRPADYQRYIEYISDSFSVATSPWKQPSRGLNRISESYNAMTLQSWFVSQLFVDPSDEGWLPQITGAGPQVIVGMRGCGKTMLLRSAQLHARAATAERQADPIATLERDRYVGLYISCTRLLDKAGPPDRELHEPYARLYLGFAREALRAMRHLQELPSTRPVVVPAGYRRIAKAVAAYISGADHLLDSTSEISLEREIQDLLLTLERGDDVHTLQAHSSIAFPFLADAVRSASPAWADSRVLFLLDDVSTRHLHPNNIAEIFSTLLFLDDHCAFKLSTEEQTLELTLYSPGLRHPAREGRDFETFELGRHVRERLADPRAGRTFLSKVLDARARQYAGHPLNSAAEILGDVSLIEIASTIANTSETSADRHYHGLGAMGAVCVGDIGDVLTIYESILRRGDLNSLPVDARIQSECFVQYCNRRLFHLNRRQNSLKDTALGFAAAAHELLIRSRDDRDTKGRPRLRQYTNLYVRVTTGDAEAQFAKLRDLMDAGVFVLAGGPGGPRLKTRDADPVSQYILSYRKLFGLSSWIGLSDRDRFELSGRDLAEWLEHPERTRDILLRNARRGDDADDAFAAILDELETSVGDAHRRGPRPGRTRRQRQITPRQRNLWESLTSAETAPAEGRSGTRRRAQVDQVDEDELGEVDLVITADGFEDRALGSSERVSQAVRAGQVRIASYPAKGHVGIERAYASTSSDVKLIDHQQLLGELAAPFGARMLIDVSGLSKPLIFHAVRRALRDRHEVLIAHTAALNYYPLNDEIASVLDALVGDEPHEQLEQLSRVWPEDKDVRPRTGDELPYSLVSLLRTDADDARNVLLLAAAAPKAQRLLKLLDDRHYDRIEIVEPSSDSPRSRLARLAAEVAVAGIEDAGRTPMDGDDLDALVAWIAEQHDRYYTPGNYDIELALTGSKLHAVACGAAAATMRIAQCWYVKPAGFDRERVSTGVGQTTYYRLTLPSGTTGSAVAVSEAEAVPGPAN
jgi:hypothetical protein